MKKMNDSLYYEAFKESVMDKIKYNLGAKLTAETLSNETHEKIKKEIEELLKEGLNLDAINKHLCAKYPLQSSIVIYQIKKFKERENE